MPATAGRVRMPANNRVHSSAALQTHGIWQSAIGYDPYAPTKDDSSRQTKAPNSNEADAENTYASFQGLLALARITGTNSDEARGACKKCGRVGHLTFQCRNFIKGDDKGKEKDPSAALQDLDRLIPGKKFDRKETSDESSVEEESDDSDSDVDPDIERVLAARSGKKVMDKVKSSHRTRGSDDKSNSEDRKTRGRSRSRRRKDSDDEDESDRKRTKDKRKKRRDSEDERRHHHSRRSRKEKRRRRRRYSESSDGSEESESDHNRKKRRGRPPSDSDGSSSDDSRTGRKLKRSEKQKKRNGRRERD